MELVEDNIAGFDVPSNYVYRIAEYLVLMSHENINQRQTFKVQDMIKHCNLLIASGHDPENFGKFKIELNDELNFLLALTAVEPLVHDLFLVRSKNETSEVESQRMVLVQILLRSVRHKKVKEILFFILSLFSF